MVRFYLEIALNTTRLFAFNRTKETTSRVNQHISGIGFKFISQINSLTAI